MSNGAIPSEAFPPEWLSDVLEHVPAIVWLWDRDAGCTYVSSAWTRITGRPAAEAWGEGWSRSVHPDDVGAFAMCRAAMHARRRARVRVGSAQAAREDGQQVTMPEHP